MSLKIGIAVIGSGRAGMIHARNFAHNVPGAKLVALVDRDEDTLSKAASDLGIDATYTQFEKVLERDDVHAIVIVTPTHLHRNIAVDAAKAGKHILCEKPMALNEEQCNEMIQAAEENQVKLQIGFMRRFDASYREAKVQIQNGIIGQVVLVKSVTRGPSVPQPWMYDIKSSNGPLAEVNSHDIDTLRWFTESEFDSLYAIGANYRSTAAKESYPDFYDNVTLITSFKNGMQGYIDGAQGVLYGYDARTEIVGTEGVIFIGTSHENRTIVCNQRNGINAAFTRSWRTLFSDAYLEEDREFIKSIINDTKPLVSGYDGKMAVRVVNAGNSSIATKELVRL